MAKRILIIDDDPDNRAMAVSLLAAVPGAYDVYSSPDGLTGISIALDEQPDLVLLDWQMPGMDGIEVLQALKNDPATVDIPVIMYTGIMTDSRSLRKALDLGAYDFLRKPVEPIEMEARINAAIRLVEENRRKIEAERRMLALEKEQVEKELENKKREATDYALFLAKKNETLITISEKLKEIVHGNGLPAKHAELINELIAEITGSVSGLQHYERFMSIFQELHPSFIDKVLSINKELSSNDLKLLRFIKLNFANKEISSLLNVSPAAVEKSKYRLKQKLSLGSEQSVYDFVAAL